MPKGKTNGMSSPIKIFSISKRTPQQSQGSFHFRLLHIRHSKSMRPDKIPWLYKWALFKVINLISWIAGAEIVNRKEEGKMPWKGWRQLRLGGRWLLRSLELAMPACKYWRSRRIIHKSRWSYKQPRRAHIWAPRLCWRSRNRLLKMSRRLLRSQRLWRAVLAPCMRSSRLNLLKKSPAK